jgi:hypothetical protein
MSVAIFHPKDWNRVIRAITIHASPLTPCTLIQLVAASFFVSLLVLEIGPSKRSFELPLQWWRCFEIRFFNLKKGIEAFVPITTHSHPLTPRTGIQLVIASFFVSLLVLEIRPSKRPFELPWQLWHVENHRSCNQLNNTTLLFLLPDMTALTMGKN